MEKLKIFNFRIGKSSPRFIFLFLILLILFLELGIMIALDYLDYNNHLINAFIDAALLIISITPFLYFFVYRPNLNYIREFKTMSQTIEESEKKYREIVENSPDAIIVHETGKIVISNNESLRLMGLTNPSEIIGKMAIQFVHPDYRAMAIERMKTAAIEGTHLPLTEEKFIRPDGSVLDMEVKSMAITYENKPAVQLIIRDITVRKQAEQALKESELFLRESERIAQMGSWENDIINQKTRWSENCFVLYGLTPFELEPTFEYFKSRLHPDDLHIIDESFVAILKERLPITQEFRIIFSDRTFKWIKNRMIPIFKDDNLVLLRGINLDITERKRAEEQISTILHTTIDGYYLLDTEGQILEVNDSYCSMIGYSREELLKMKIADVEVIYPDEAIRKRIQRILETGYDFFETKHLRKDGKIIAIEASVNFLNYEQPKLFCFLRDITERKLAEESMQKLNLAIGNSQEVVFITDKEGIITYVNPEFTRLYGYTSEEVVGKVTPRILNSSIYKKEDFKSFWDSLISKQSIPKSEYVNKCKDGKLIAVEGSANPVINTDGELIGFLGIQRDITERKKAENKILEANEQLVKINNEKDKFFSIIAHDLRAPFSGFLGLTQIMAEKLTEMNQEQIHEIVQSLKKSATKLYGLLENLLQWAQVQKGVLPFNPKVIQLLPMVNESIEVFLEPAKSKEIEITNQIPDGLNVFADKNTFQTVIRNLLSNAMKFTPSGGRISLSAKTIDGENIEIAISDTGIGMSQTLIDNLFRIDVSTSRPGTEGEASSGLGLLLCKEFIEKHQGKIWIESIIGKGSTFYFTVPFSAKPKEKQVPENEILPSAKETQEYQLKILIAEDDEASSQLISILVRKFGKEVLLAKTGTEAVEVCRENPDIDLVLMDIKMPEMDGYEATRQIRKFNQEVVIIAQTAYAQAGDREKALATGCNDHISKPIGKVQLQDMLHKHFREQELI